MPNYFGFAGEIQMECQHPKTSEAKAILILNGLMSRLKPRPTTRIEPCEIKWCGVAPAGSPLRRAPAAEKSYLT